MISMWKDQNNTKAPSPDLERPRCQALWLGCMCACESEGRGFESCLQHQRPWWDLLFLFTLSWSNIIVPEHYLPTPSCLWRRIATPRSGINRDFAFFCVWTNVKSASTPFEQSFSHAKAQQRSDNLPQHDEALGSPEGGLYMFFFSM